MPAFTLFVQQHQGQDAMLDTSLARDGFIPDLFVGRHTLPGYVHLGTGTVFNGMAFFVHHRFQRDVPCMLHACLHAGMAEIGDTRLLITDSSNAEHLQACANIFKSEPHVTIGAGGVQCTSTVTLTHSEVVPYGQYFVFEPL